MIDRVFDGSEVPCLCVFETPTGDKIRARVLKISKSKAILDSSAELDAGLDLSTVLHFGDGTELCLEASIQSHPSTGLFLSWKHADSDDAGRLQVTLIQQAGEPTPIPGDASAEENEAQGYLGSLLSKTRQVDSKSLAAQHSRLRVVGMGDITRLIEASVEQALANSEHMFSEKEREKLLNEAQDVFQARLDDMRQQRETSEARATEVEAQLQKAEALLEEERERILSADQFTVSNAGMMAIEERMERLLVRVVRDHEVDNDVQEEMRNFVSGLLDQEREKILEKEQSAQSDSLRLLEHKVKRLAQALEETSAERDSANRRAAALEASGGGVAGLVFQAGLGEDPDKERKLLLLQDLVQENRDVRKAMGIETEPPGPSKDSSAVETTPQPSVSGTPAVEEPIVEEPIAEAQPPPPSRDESPTTDESPAEGVKKIQVRRVAPPPLERA